MVLQTGCLPEHRQRQSLAVSDSFSSVWRILIADLFTGWTTTVGQTAHLALRWEEQMPCMAHSITSYYYLAELQISLRKTGSENSSKWHFKEANGYPLQA